MKQLLNNDPNFSIVLPGGCNAKCKFCFAKPETKKCGYVEYLKNLDLILSSLSDDFYQISITGGEPTLSPMLLPVLSVISRHRNKYNNVLVTSNGTNLADFASEFEGVVDHINISRHHYNDTENLNIFGGSYSIETSNIKHIVDVFGSIGIDVSLNCVINNETKKDFIDSYIDFSISCGVAAVRFRKENGDNEPTPVESEFQNYRVLWDGACLVCKTRKRVIKGLDVFWKTSVVEPNEVSDGKIFELVYLQNGLLYSDWEGKSLIVPRAKATEIPIPKKKVLPTYYNYSRGGASKSSCGGSASRC